MKKLEITHGNGKTSVYNLIEEGNDLPIAYDESTPEDLVRVLERCRKNRTRIKLDYGDMKTGISYHEDCGTSGTIGLSRGKEARFPLLISTSRSTGGPLLFQSIIRIRESRTKRSLYQSPVYKPSTFDILPCTDTEGYVHKVHINGKLYSRHKNLESANRLVKKLS